jgi:hypothetical protein
LWLTLFIAALQVAAVIWIVAWVIPLTSGRGVTR